jgi:hypothetical protein
LYWSFILTSTFTSFQSKRNEKCFTVTWSGIQKALEQAQSDVLILLDCCSSGIGDAGEGNGVTELMSACAFDMTANGVGHYSFTKALTIELRLLSKKRSFPVVELYTHIYCRAQHHMAQGIDNERYPAPIHLLLTRDDHFPRSIQLSIQEPHPEQDLSLEPGHSSYELNPARPVNHKRRLSRESAESPKKRPCLDENNSSLEAGLDSSITQYWGAPQDVALQNDCAGSEVGLMSNNESAIFGRYPRDSLQLESAHAPRLLFAVRLEENIRAEDLSPEYFTDWLRMIPTIAREVRVEAGFECNSTLLLVSLPLCLKPYLPHHSAIISLGPVKSSNLLAESYLREEMATIKRDSHFSPETAENERRAAASGESEPREMIQADDQPDTGSEGFAESYISSCESLKSDFEKYPEENGRTYHSYNAGRYMFPNDEPEKDRLDLQNHLFSLTFGGKLCVSPVTQTNTIHCVLDVGTGTGIWAIDFAVEHPGAKVIGVDLSPIQPKFVPPNLCFEIADLEDSWTFHEKFDFIYCRMMTASIRNWPQFFTNSFE